MNLTTRRYKATSKPLSELNPNARITAEVVNEVFSMIADYTESPDAGENDLAALLLHQLTFFANGAEMDVLNAIFLGSAALLMRFRETPHGLTAAAGGLLAQYCKKLGATATVPTQTTS